MDSKLQASMFEYFNKRAPEYEEKYLSGQGPTSIHDPETYKSEVKILGEIIGTNIKGKSIDIGCGAGFWLPYYNQNCENIYLFDQSLNMLSKCKAMAESLSIRERCSFLIGDFWSYHFNQAYFDSVLIGFFFSHVPVYNEYRFFKKLRSILKEQAVFLILDSTWNKEKSKTRSKEGNQQRVLNDGRAYDIYKRYFTHTDFKSMEKKYNIQFTIQYTGKVFMAVKGIFLE